MSILFSKPKAPDIPKPPPAPVAPTPESLEKNAAAEVKESNLSFLKKKNRSKTLLTGPGGVDESGKKKTILG